MPGHRKMSGEDKSKEAVTAEGQNTTATLLRTQTCLWMQNLSWFQGHRWESRWRLDLLGVTGKHQGQESPQGKYIWKPVQCWGSVMLACLEPGKEGRSCLSLAQGGSAQARSGVQGMPCRSDWPRSHSCPVCFMAEAPQHSQQLCHLGGSR